MGILFDNSIDNMFNMFDFKYEKRIEFSFIFILYGNTIEKASLRPSVENKPVFTFHLNASLKETNLP